MAASINNTVKGTHDSEILHNTVKGTQGIESLHNTEVFWKNYNSESKEYFNNHVNA